MDPAALRNRLVMATSMWREHTEEPLAQDAPRRSRRADRRLRAQAGRDDVRQGHPGHGAQGRRPDLGPGPRPARRRPGQGAGAWPATRTWRGLPPRAATSRGSLTPRMGAFYSQRVKARTLGFLIVGVAGISLLLVAAPALGHGARPTRRTCSCRSRPAIGLGLVLVSAPRRRHGPARGGRGRDRRVQRGQLPARAGGAGAHHLHLARALRVRVLPPDRGLRLHGGAGPVVRPRAHRPGRDEPVRALADRDRHPVRGRDAALDGGAAGDGPHRGAPGERGAGPGASSTPPPTPSSRSTRTA